MSAEPTSQPSNVRPDPIDQARAAMRANLDLASQMALSEVVTPVAFLFTADAEGYRQMLLVPLLPIPKDHWPRAIDQLLRQHGGYAYGIISEAITRKVHGSDLDAVDRSLPGQDILLATFEAAERSITWFRPVSPETTLPHRTLGPIETLEQGQGGVVGLQGRLTGLGAVRSVA
jgi:hypothetical protein